MGLLKVSGGEQPVELCGEEEEEDDEPSAKEDEGDDPGRVTSESGGSAPPWSIPSR